MSRWFGRFQREGSATRKGESRGAPRAWSGRARVGMARRPVARAALRAAAEGHGRRYRRALVDHRRRHLRLMGCGLDLFHSKDKFDAGCGGSYTKPIEDRVVFTEATAARNGAPRGMCAGCGGHLGHIFPDGPPPRETAVHQLGVDCVQAGGVSQRWSPSSPFWPFRSGARSRRC